MKLFVGNLSFDTTEPELRAIFEQFEPIVEFIRPNDRETGRPRGFAFITLSDQEKGTAAIEALDGSELGGRQISVKEAEERGYTPGPAPWQANNSSADKKRVDDRPTDDKGKKVRYKSI